MCREIWQQFVLHNPETKTCETVQCQEHEQCRLEQPQIHMYLYMYTLAEYVRKIFKLNLKNDFHDINIGIWLPLMFLPMCRSLTARWKRRKDVPQMQIQKSRYRYRNRYRQIQSYSYRYKTAASGAFRGSIARASVAGTLSSVVTHPLTFPAIPCLLTNSLGGINRYRYIIYIHICPSVYACDFRVPTLLLVYPLSVLGEPIN